MWPLNDALFFILVYFILFFLQKENAVFIKDMFVVRYGYTRS